MESGHHQLQHAATAYLCAIAFATTFLASIAFGVGLGNALLRGVLVLIAARVVAPQLARPAIDAVLEAMARDRESKLAAQADENDDEATKAPASDLDGKATHSS